MSGGSLNYVGRAMADGDVDSFMRHVDRMRDELERLLVAVNDGTLRGAEPFPGSLTSVRDCAYQHASAAQIAIPALLAQLDAAVVAVARARETLADLAEIGTVIDRKLSGDDSARDIADEAVNWMRKRLALPPLDFELLRWGMTNEERFRLLREQAGKAGKP